MPSEFDLIDRYFARHNTRASEVALGIGDDCALLKMPSASSLAISTDMLVEGRHFFPQADPFKLGHKSLAVNLSDLAAMGARPIAFTLALSLPEADEAWLASFSSGLFALADRFECALIGGDTTKGPLNICITVFGEIANDRALRRDRAQVGDDIWVSGTLGDARLALAAHRSEITLEDKLLEVAAARLHTPMPRIALGLALRGYAHAAIDISDGLAGDLKHVLQRSGVGATLDVDTLPVGAALAAQPVELQRTFALTGGDDYELCFTARASVRQAIINAADTVGVQATRIGTIDTGQGLRLIDASGHPLDLPLASFDHFISP